jgi:hypothetical protein
MENLIGTQYATSIVLEKLAELRDLETRVPQEKNERICKKYWHLS